MTLQLQQIVLGPRTYHFWNPLESYISLQFDFFVILRNKSLSRLINFLNTVYTLIKRSFK